MELLIRYYKNILYIMQFLGSMESKLMFVAVISIVILHLIGGCCDKYKLIEINLFGRQVNLTVIVLMAAIYGLIVVSTLGGCCNEGFTNLIKANLASDAASTSMARDNIPSLFGDNAQFKPECCPSTYSNSKGCYCANK